MLCEPLREKISTLEKRVLKNYVGCIEEYDILGAIRAYSMFENQSREDYLYVKELRNSSKLIWDLVKAWRHLHFVEKNIIADEISAQKGAAT